jgi:hypothetical protein
MIYITHLALNKYKTRALLSFDGLERTHPIVWAHYLCIHECMLRLVLCKF